MATPPVPLGTLIGIGEDKHNNKPGYTVEFVLVDTGEPGGNLQAHYDQPHKK